MPNDQLALKVFSQKISESEVSKMVDQVIAIISKQSGRLESEVRKEFQGIQVGEDLADQIISELKKASQILGNKSFNIGADLFKGIFDAKGVEDEINKVVKTFENKIGALTHLKDQIGDDKIFANMMNNIDTDQLDELINKTRQLIELEQERNNLSGTDKAKVTRQIKALDRELSASIGQIKIDFNVDTGKINEANEALSKYNVSQEEALKKAKELSKQRNVSSSYIDKDNIDDIKDMIAYMQRYIELVKQAGGSEDEALKKLRSEVGASNVRRLTGASGDSGYSDYKDEIQGVRTEVSKLKQEAREIGTGGQLFDESELKKQQQELNNVRESLTKANAQLDEMNQKYSEQSNLINELENKLKALEGINNPKVIETEEYKNIISELETAKNKASEFQNEMDELRQTVEVLKSSLSSYNTGDVVPRQDLENANRVIDNLSNKINELEISLTETKNKFTSLSEEVTKLQQDKSDLSGQLSQQKEINAAQEEQISNSQKIKIELDEIKKKYQDLTNSIKEMEDVQSRYMSLLDKFGQAEAFNKAMRNVDYNEGRNTPEGFVNFDYLDKAKQKLQETGNAYEKATKAAVYYYQYLQKGGTEKIFNKDGKDISDELISLYKEMSSLADDKTGQISYESINKTVREYANELRLAREEQSREKDLINQKNKELKETLSLEKNIAKTKQESKKAEEQTKDTTVKSSGKRKMSREESVGFSTYRQKEQQVNQKDSSDTSQQLPQDSSSIISEQQALENLEKAINSVTIAIAQKNQAIQAEEVQMDYSVNEEIAKLKELENKLTVIRTEFQNGILSRKNTGTGNEANVEGNINTDENNNITADVTLNPKLSDTFKADANNLLDDVNLEKDVNLKPTYEAGKFKEDAERILAFENVEKEVNLKVGDLDTSGITGTASTITSPVSENVANDNVIEDQNKRLEEQETIYNNIIRLLTEYLSLQDRINSGNKNIVDGSYIDPDDIRKQTGKVSQRAVKDKLNEYLSMSEMSESKGGIYSDATISSVKEELAAYVANLNNAEKASEIFGNKNKELFDEITQMINESRVSLDAFENAQSNLNTANLNISELTNGQKLDPDKFINFENILKTDGLEAGLKYITDELGVKIPEAAKKAESALNDVDKKLRDDEVKDNKPFTIQVDPEINSQTWLDAIDHIISLIGTRRIKVEPDISEEWNNFKTFVDQISNQVINLKINGNVENVTTDDSGNKTQKQSSYTKNNDNSEEIKRVNDLLDQQRNKWQEIQDIRVKISSLDPVNDANEISNLNSQKTNLEQELSGIQKEIDAYDTLNAKKKQSNELDKITSNADKQVNANTLERINKLQKEYVNNLKEQNRVALEIAKYPINDAERSDEDTEKLVNYQKELNDLTNEQSKLIEKINKALTEEESKSKNISKALDSLKEASKTDVSDIGRVTNIDDAYKSALRINDALNKTENSMNILRKEGKGDIFEEAFSAAESDIRELNIQLTSGTIGLTQYNSKISEIKRNLATQKNAIAIVDDVQISNIDETRNVLDHYINEVTRGTVENTKFNEGTKTLSGTFKNARGEIQNVSTSIKTLSDGTNVVVKSFGTAQEEVSSFSKWMDELGGKFRNLSTYLLSFVGFYEVWGAFRQGVTYVKEFDSALTEMRKVSNETVSTLKEFQQASFDIADSVGATAGVIQNSTADWMRLGESLEEASKSAEVSNILLNVSEFEDISSATDALVSMSQAYQDLDKIDIVDKMNNIGNNYSIATDGIATALQDSASALVTAGNDIDEAIALITAGNAVVQDPNSVGAGKLMPEHTVMYGCLFL